MQNSLFESDSISFSQDNYIAEGKIIYNCEDNYTALYGTQEPIVIVNHHPKTESSLKSPTSVTSEFDYTSPTADANTPSYRIPGEVIRRSWISASTQKRSPRFHCIFGLGLAKMTFSDEELAGGSLRGIGKPLDKAKLAAVHACVIKYLGWKDQNEIKQRLREVDASIDSMCREYRRKVALRIT